LPSSKKLKNNSKTKPYLVQPVVSQPVVSQPVVSQPVVSSPVVSSPVAPQPVVSQPVVSQPVAPQPVVSSPTSSSAHPESHSAPGDSSGPLYSAYILMFFALFYIGTLSAFINRFGTDDCKIYTDGKRNFIRGLSWTMIGISIFFIIFAVCEAKGFIITQWFTPKWIHMLSFIYYLVMFMLSLFLYIMFNFNDSGEKDSSVKQLLCDDFKDDQGVIIEGSIHSTIDILFDILLISSIVMTLISLAFHMMKDTQGNA
jgi:hypothetical protein